MTLELIQNGLPLLGLRVVRPEAFWSTQGGGSSGVVPVRDRQQHAAVLNQRVAEVERELSIARDQALPGTSGALVAAIGPGLEESKVNKQLRDRATGTDVVTVREGRAVVHVESDLGALRTKIGAYARENTPKPGFDIIRRP